MPVDGNGKSLLDIAQEKTALNISIHKRMLEKNSRRDNLKIGSSNVRTISNGENIKMEMKRMNKDILGICKTRLTGTGIIKSGNS